MGSTEQLNQEGSWEPRRGRVSGEREQQVQRVETGHKFRNWEQHDWEEWECQTEAWAYRESHPQAWEWDIVRGFLPGGDEALVWVNTYADTASLNGHSWWMDYYGLTTRKAGTLDWGPSTTMYRWNENSRGEAMLTCEGSDETASRGDLAFALSPTWDCRLCCTHMCWAFHLPHSKTWHDPQPTQM